MPEDSRMTIRLDPAARRRVERLASQQGISLNEAVNLLLREAPDHGVRAARARRYRLKPRKIGFGFEIARSRQIAAEMSDARALETITGRP